MAQKTYATQFVAVALTALLATPALAQNVLTGDTKLACEATLCLASGTQPSECNESLKKYLSIQHKKAKDTAKARANFLKLCPKV